MNASRQELEAVFRRRRPVADLLDKPRDTNNFLAKQAAVQLEAARIGVFKVPDDVWAKFHGALVAALNLKPTPNINLDLIEGFPQVQSACADVEPEALALFIRCHIALHLSEPMHGADKAEFLAGLLQVAASAITIQREVLPMATRMVAIHEKLSGAAVRSPVPAEPDEPEDAQVAMPVLVNDGFPPVTSGGIANAFDGLKWDESKWLVNLGQAKVKWLKDARLSKGLPGGRVPTQATWNPVLIGLKLCQRDGYPAKTVRARFQTNTGLQPWLGNWDDIQLSLSEG